MMEEQAIPLTDGRGRPNDVYNWDILGVAAGNGIDETQLTNAKGRYDSRDAFNSGVTIGSIPSVELITVADPIQSNFGYVIESYLHR